MWREARRKTFELLDTGRRDSRASRACRYGLGGLIVLNVIAVIVESLPQAAAAYGPFFAAFEIFSIAVFSAEYLLRLWSCVDAPFVIDARPVRGRLRYALTPLALIDLLVILPFYIALIGPIDLRFMRVLRLMRLLKLTRYSRSMSLLFQVLRAEAGTIGSALMILLVLLILFASFAYLAEHRAQPHAFRSIPDAMWWAVVTMTTVGYGDVTPVTVLGKLVGAAIGIIGIGMVALPAGILAAGFSERLQRRAGAGRPGRGAADGHCPHCGAPHSHGDAPRSHGDISPSHRGAARSTGRIRGIPGGS